MDVSNPAIVSVPADSLSDEEIERASVPNLAALFKSAQDKGLIKPQPEYPGSTTT